jgi:hypothetical protein
MEERVRLFNHPLSPLIAGTNFITNPEGWTIQR